MWHPDSFGTALLATVVFGLVGIILAVIGFKLFDWVTPFNLEKEMCENRNPAVGILCGAIVLGVCIIVGGGNEFSCLDDEEGWVATITGKRQ